MMLRFCLHSLFREYGWQFFRHVILRHPIKAAKAFITAGYCDFSGEIVANSVLEPSQGFGGEKSIVGVGFCMKPMTCMSGRSNHDCHYLEHLVDRDDVETPACCQQCTIREIGIKALKAGMAFYIMTSAKDILFDLFKPNLDESRFASGLFVLCRYSFEPFAMGMLLSDISGRLFPFEQGDCRDYKTWLLADRGIKNDQTIIDGHSYESISALLEKATRGQDSYRKFMRQGNIFISSTYPRQSI